MPQPEATLTNGEIVLDLDNCRAFVGRKRLDLTPTEFNLLAQFLLNQHRTLTRAGLLRKVWGGRYRGTPRTVDTHVQRLRAKLGAAGRHLETVRGAGYRLRAKERSE